MFTVQNAHASSGEDWATMAHQCRPFPVLRMAYAENLRTASSQFFAFLPMLLWR